MSKDAYEQFLAEVLQGVPDESRAAIEGALKDTQIAPKIRERVLARSDYSRQSDALRAEREAFQREVSEARTKIQGWEKWYGETSQQQAQLQERLNAYQSQFGDLEDGTVKPQGISQEVFDKRLADEFDRRDRDAIAFADLLTELKLDHRDKFKEKLDTRALVQYATEHNLPLQAAYREFVAPKDEELRAADLEAKIKAAKEEGKREALSEHKLPVASGFGDVHTLDRVASVGKNANERIANATRHWNEQGNHSLY